MWYGLPAYDVSDHSTLQVLSDRAQGPVYWSAFSGNEDASERFVKLVNAQASAAQVNVGFPRGWGCGILVLRGDPQDVNNFDHYKITQDAVQIAPKHGITTLKMKPWEVAILNCSPRPSDPPPRQ